MNTFICGAPEGWNTVIGPVQDRVAKDSENTVPKFREVGRVFSWTDKISVAAFVFPEPIVRYGPRLMWNWVWTYKVRTRPQRWSSPFLPWRRFFWSHDLIWCKLNTCLESSQINSAKVNSMGRIIKSIPRWKTLAEHQMKTGNGCLYLLGSLGEAPM